MRINGPSPEIFKLSFNFESSWEYIIILLSIVTDNIEVYRWKRYGKKSTNSRIRDSRARKKNLYFFLCTPHKSILASLFFIERYHGCFTRAPRPCVSFSQYLWFCVCAPYIDRTRLICYFRDLLDRTNKHVCLLSLSWFWKKNIISYETLSD